MAKYKIGTESTGNKSIKMDSGMWANPVDNKSKWISVDDELPKEFDGQPVVVFDHMDVVHAKYDTCHGRFYIGCQYLSNVTHWQSLPEPPKDIK